MDLKFIRKAYCNKTGSVYLTIPKEIAEYLNLKGREVAISPLNDGFLVTPI